MNNHNTWPGWEYVRQIGVGAYGNVYEIEREETGFKRKAALKVISVPASPEEVEAGYSESLYETREGAQSYFQSQIDRVTTEFAIMDKLKGYTNIVSYDDHMVIPHEDGIGADILIRMELLTPLDRYRREHELSEAEVIKIGVDICSALDVCQRQEPPILHRDIKPANIMVNETGDFKLGDFGISRVIENDKSAHTVAGSPPYMAPEVHLGKSYQATADIYSLGIVLYRLLNNNRNPFLPVEGNLTAEMQERAKRTRFAGEAVPEPCKGSPELKRVVLKALEYEPGKRFQTAREFREGLMAVASRTQREKHYRICFADKDNHVIQQQDLREGEPIIPPDVSHYPGVQGWNPQLHPGAKAFRDETYQLVVNEIIDVPVCILSDDGDQKRPKKMDRKKLKTPVIIASAALLVVLAVAGVFWSMTRTRTEQVLDSDGKLTYELVYNRKEQEIKRTKYDSDENVVFCEEYKYDENGNQITAIRYEPDGSLDYTTDFVYDDKGKRIKGTVYDPDGSVTAYLDTFSYDDDGVVTSYKVYDESEKLLYLNYVDKDDMPLSAIFYDDDGLILQEQTFDSDGECVEVTDYKYHNGRLEETLVTSGSGDFISRSEYEYEADGSYHTEIYDENKHVIGGSFYDADGNVTSNVTIEYESNGLASKQINYDTDNNVQYETFYYYYADESTMFEVTYNADHKFIQGTGYLYWYDDETIEVELSMQSGNRIGGKAKDMLNDDILVLIDFDKETFTAQDNYITGKPCYVETYDISSGKRIHSQYYNLDGSERSEAS